MNTESEIGLNQAVADVLRGELAVHDWTLADLSNASGIPKVSVQRYLRGTRGIDVDILDKLARAFGTSAMAVLAQAVELAERRRGKAVATGQPQRRRA